MTPRDLPGFYFDEQKQKYFRITPNHIAPSNAKYAQTNVHREQQQAKKQKLEVNHAHLLRLQTVRRAPVLHHSLLGANLLLRELGAARSTRREEIFLHAMKQSQPIALSPPVRDAHWVGDRMAVISNGTDSHGRKKSVLLSYGAAGKEPIIHCVLEPEVRSTQMTTVFGTPHYLACTDSQGQSPNVVFGNIEHFNTANLRWRVNDTLVDCAVNEVNLFAFSGENAISICDTSTQTTNEHRLHSNVSGAATEWMDVNILAFGTRGDAKNQKQKQKRKHAVMLWDVRAAANGDSLAERIVRRARITGISKPNPSGHNLIVTSNHEISLYDFRVLKTDRPLLSLPHVSEGPETYHSTHNGSMLAAIDQHQKVQLYSLRTGKHVKTLTSSNSGVLRHVRWYEDRHGPLLQACSKDSVLFWEMEL